MSSRVRQLTWISLGIAIAVAVGWQSTSVRASTILSVPAQYPTIQAAVDAASPGDAIQVRAGTYAEQLLLTKDLTLEGAGRDSTTISPPATPLVPFAGSLPGVITNPLEQSVVDALGIPLSPVPLTALVHVTLGAHVKMSGFTVSGPFVGSCDAANGHLRRPVTAPRGIQVSLGGALELSNTRVTRTRDEAPALCNNSGIVVGLSAFSVPDGSVGHASIKGVEVDDYSGFGIAVLGAAASKGPSTASITESLIVGAGPSLFGGSGIAIRFGARATIRENQIRANHCVIPGFCGPDPVNQFQDAGVLVDANPSPGVPPFSVAPLGTVVAENVISDNDTGIYIVFAPACCTIRENRISDNRWFGVTIQDGSNDTQENSIRGGQIGIGVVAGGFSNSVSTLVRSRGDLILDTSVAPIQTLTCAVLECFENTSPTATAIVLKP
jgi:hypothetical protein